MKSARMVRQTKQGVYVLVEDLITVVPHKKCVVLDMTLVFMRGMFKDIILIFQLNFSH